MIRRAPWISAGAVGAYLLDPENGPRRRTELGARLRRGVDQATAGVRARWQERREGLLDSEPDTAPAAAATKSAAQDPGPRPQPVDPSAIAG